MAECFTIAKIYEHTFKVMVGLYQCYIYTILFQLIKSWLF